MSTRLLAAAAALAASLSVSQGALAQVTNNAQDWRNDAPGVAHRIDVATLPAPFATKSAADFPRIVAKPDDAELKLPPGFKIEVFTRDVEKPRTMRVAPNGDIFLAETQSVVIQPMGRGTTQALNGLYGRP